MKLLVVISLCVFFVSQNVVAKAAPSDDDSIVFLEEDEFDTDDILKSDGPNEILSKRGKKKPKDLQIKGFFQGDIKLSEAQKSDVTSRTGVRFDYQKWTKNDDGHAVVPYIIEDYVYGS